MKAIYTYYVNNENYKLGFQNKKVMLDCFRLSIESVKKYVTEKIEIYTNSDFLDGKIEAKIIKTEFPEHNKKWWNFPKMFVYQLQTEPFLHVDIDVIFKEEISSVILNSDFICENIRGLSLMSSEYNHIIKSDYKCYIPCSGIFGGSRLDVFKELYDKAILLQDQIEDPAFTDLFLVEEAYTATLLNKKGITMTSIPVEYFKHIQGERKKKILCLDDLKEYMK